jgi:hypothetical protein
MPVLTVKTRIRAGTAKKVGGDLGGRLRGQAESERGDGKKISRADCMVRPPSRAFTHRHSGHRAPVLRLPLPADLPSGQLWGVGLDKPDKNRTVIYFSERFRAVEGYKSPDSIVF